MTLMGNQEPSMEPEESETAARQKHVVILDDDAKLRVLASEYLEAHDLKVTSLASGAELRRLIEREPVDIVVLDVMLPGEDGLTILRRLAASPNPPAVLMLSAMASDYDRIVGLELGADDYIAKPVNPRELLARVRAVLRRQPAGTVTRVPEGVISCQGWEIDPIAHSARAPNGVMLDLTTGEFRLLLALARRAGRVTSRNSLIGDLHGEEADCFDRAVDVGISRLRSKLARHGGGELIRTVRGEGYLFAGRG